MLFSGTILNSYITKELKMKKIHIIVLALFIVLTTAFVFVSCQSKSKNDDKQFDNNSGESINNPSNGSTSNNQSGNGNNESIENPPSPPNDDSQENNDGSSPDAPVEDDSFCCKNFEFALNDDNNSFKIVGKGNCEHTEVIIPKTYNGLPVTAIEKRAFKKCNEIISIHIPTTVSNIGEGILSECNSLKAVDIPFIGSNSLDDSEHFGHIFGNASSFDASEYEYHIIDNKYGIYLKYEIPESLKSVTVRDTKIGNRAFACCDYIESITLAEGTTIIKDKAFELCSNLKTIIIPNTVTEIGTSAFYYCTNLSNVIVPNSVTKIGFGAFNACYNINSIVLPFVGSTKDEIENSHFGYIFGISNNSYYQDVQGLYSVIITGGTYIAPYAFYGCYNLKNIELPQTLIEIGEGAFRSCSNLITLTIPFVGGTLDGEKFNNFSYIFATTGSNISENLKTVTILGGTIIAEDAFYGCSNIENIYLPDTISTIGDSAFYNCKSLKYNEYDNAYYIGSLNNPYLVLIDAKNRSISSCDVNKNAKFIATAAFENCKQLVTIDIPNTLVSIGNGAFIGCYKLENITLPDDLHFLGYRAFDDCRSITEIIIPDGVTKIGYESFNNCWELENVVIGDRVTIIEEDAFRDCGSLQILKLGSGLNTIEKNAFCNCDNLNSIYISDVSSWCQINFIGTDSNPLCYQGRLYVGNKLLSSIVIPDDVVSIPEYAFYCQNLLSVTLPQTISSIGNYAFAGTNITEINIPSSVISIGNYAFAECENLKNISISDSVTSIGIGAFYYCTDLQRIILPQNLKVIQNKLFLGCSSLEYIFIPTSVIAIGDKSIYVSRKTDRVVYGGDFTSWDSIDKDLYWLASDVIYNDYDFSNQILVCSEYIIEMDFETLMLPASNKKVLLVPLYGYGKFTVIDSKTKDVVTINSPNIHFEISNSAGEISLDEYGTLVGKKCGMTQLSIYYIYNEERIYTLKDQLIFIAECSFNNSKSYAKFSESDKEYIQMCLDFTYTLPKVISPTLSDFKISDHFWNTVGKAASNLMEKLKDGEYNPNATEIKRNIATIIQKYVDEIELQKYINNNAQLTIQMIEDLISLTTQERQDEYNLLSQEQKNELNNLVSLYNKAKTSEEYKETLQSLNKMLSMFSKNDDTLNIISKILKWESIDMAQRALSLQTTFTNILELSSFDKIFDTFVNISSFTFDAFIYLMHDYSANIEILRFLKNEFKNITNVDADFILAIDQLIDEYSNKWAIAVENWLRTFEAEIILGIGHFVVNMIFPEFKIVMFLINSYGNSTFAAKKSELYTLSMMSSAIYDTLDPIMDMFMMGKQTISTEKLKVLVLLYLNTVKAENDLVAYNFWSDYPFSEKKNCAYMSQYIASILSLYF